MNPDRPSLTQRLFSPTAMLASALAAAVALAIAPARWTDPLRAATARALGPGQTVAIGAGRYADQVATRVKSHFQTASRLAELEDEVVALRQENQRLTAQRTAAPNGDARFSGQSDEDADRLLNVRCEPARVLGRQARAFLIRQHLLDIGTESGIQPDALVVDHPPLVDEGDDARLRVGQLVLSGRGVWGKIVQLGPHTSVIRTMTEPGYRDLVQIGSAPNCRGILEGMGQRLARVRLVEVTQPVSMGDPVYAAAEKGILSAPLLYGTVARLERPVGAAHWDLWVEPALTGDPDRVVVLRIELNPLRVVPKKTPE